MLKMTWLTSESHFAHPRLGGRASCENLELHGVWSVDENKRPIATRSRNFAMLQSPPTNASARCSSMRPPSRLLNTT